MMTGWIRGVVPGVLVIRTDAGLAEDTDRVLADIRCVASCRTKSRSDTSRDASVGVLKNTMSIYTIG